MQATYAIIPRENIIKLETEVLDPAALPPDHLLIEAETTVISTGTELANFTGIDPTVRIPGNWNTYPWRPGYGLVGHIRGVGSALENYTVGQRVFCFAKHASLQMYKIGGIHTAWPIAEDVPAVEGVMLRMAHVALSAPQMTDFDAGDTVAIFGLGLVGNLAAQLYQLAGANVIALDVFPARCELAKQCGIQTVLNVPPDAQVEAVRELTGGAGVNVAVDATGHSAVVMKCVEACATFGQIILLGSPRSPYEANVTPVLRDIHLKWLTMRGALEWHVPTYPAQGKKHSKTSNTYLLLDYLKQGRLHIDPLISHVIKPEQLPEAYDGLLNDPQQYWGVVVDWRD